MGFGNRISNEAMNHVVRFIFLVQLVVPNSCSSDGTSTEKKQNRTLAAAKAPDEVLSVNPNKAKRRKAASSLPQLSGEHHQVFSLADNRLLAHMIRRNGLFIAPGYPGVAKYLSFRRPWLPWSINEKVDDQRVALAIKPTTWLVFPLSEEQAAASSKLVLRVKLPDRQKIRIKLNETQLDSGQIEAGWQTVTLQVPSGVVRPGENRLELKWMGRGRLADKKSNAAVQWIYLGPQQVANISAVEPASEGRLVLPADGGLAYYIYAYAETKLRLRFNSQPEGARCELGVRLLARGQQAIEQRRSESGLPPGRETQTYVDLQPVANKVARLELWARGKSCQNLELLEASLVRPGPAPAVKRGEPPRNVLFWMVDNVRADRYTLYNPRTRVRTPVIEKLGKTGAVFASAYIQGTESRVSHASIWTGMYPKQHRFVAPKAKLDLRWVTLPEAIRKTGLLTAAWIANGFVSKFWGFGEGWDRFTNTIHEGGGLSAEKLADHAIGFISEHDAEKPFYIYVGTIDPHVSWRGKQPWLDEYHPEPYSGLYKKNVMGVDVEKMASGKRQTTPQDRKRIIAIYDSTVSYNDQQLGRVLEALEKKGVRDKTMIIVTADHGEELWDYTRVGHGHSLKDQLVAVPLIIHYPPMFGSGVRVEQGVDVLSLMPTLLDALGAPIPPNVQAESMLPLTHGVGAGYPRPSMATQYELAHVIRLGRYKLWVGGKGEPRLYDLGSEEKEHKEHSDPLAQRWLTDALSTFLIYQQSWRSTRWGVASNHREELPRDLESGQELETIHPKMR